jgi:2-methylisocitrate lyase-like PEP mutase family enzyme
VFVVPPTAATRFSVWPTWSCACDGASVIVTGGAGFTVTTAAADFVVLNFDVAMIVVEPGATAVTTPVVALTVATAGFVDVYVAPDSAPVVSLATFAMNVAV